MILSCYKLRRVKSETHFISPGSKIVERLRRRQYDPVIIERTIGRVLCLFTALYRSFLKRCTLSNKAVGTIWRALSKPPQRRQGPDTRPLWLLVGTHPAFGPELAYRLRVAQPTLMDVPTFFWYLILPYTNVFFFTTVLWFLRFGWLLVLSLYKDDYLHIFNWLIDLNVCPFDYTAVVVSGEVEVRLMLIGCLKSQSIIFQS